jgi:anti-sigma regulatory factor (Ser/Thr protein kinase)
MNRRLNLVGEAEVRRDRGSRELRVSPDACELAVTRRFARAAAERFGLDPPQRNEFVLAANEAVANAIEHGRPCWDGTIHTWVCERADSLTFGVRDAGDFAVVPPPADPLAERGRGLVLMSALVDEVALRRARGHTHLELVKHRAAGVPSGA